MLMYCLLHCARSVTNTVHGQVFGLRVWEWQAYCTGTAGVPALHVHTALPAPTGLALQPQLAKAVERLSGAAGIVVPARSASLLLLVAAHVQLDGWLSCSGLLPGARLHLPAAWLSCEHHTNPITNGVAVLPARAGSLLDAI
jgi:hypothetical protein